MRRATPVIVLSLTAIAGSLLYLGWSLHYGFLGFPLDDAWIHQTYARNLGQHGQLAYNLGEPSVGSTSPLWTLLLAPVHSLGLDPRVWTYLLGGVLLFLTGWVSYRLASRLFPEGGLVPLVTGAFCVLEWHLVWASFSGMETMLFTLLSLLLMERCLAGEKAFVLGLMGGLLTVTRPEGAMLLVLVAFYTLWRRSWKDHNLNWSHAFKTLVLLVVGFALPALPYLALNLRVSGNLFPNTFYAKQAEYGPALASIPIWMRWARVAWATMIGAQILLIPGCLYAAYRSVTLRRPAMILPLAWWFVLVTLYAARLPVTYQHGRYVIPAIPALLLLGVWGTKNLPRLHRVPRQALLISIPLLLVIFWITGAQQYAAEVRIIDSELKAAGSWLSDHTSPSAVVGAHDIGAVGYFSQRFLVDIAGLITPDVIPFIRDEDRLTAFLEEEKVDYVVIFPSWYRVMAKDPRLSPVYRSAAPWIREAGGDNVVVYSTEWDLSRWPLIPAPDRAGGFALGLSCPVASENHW